MVAVGSPCGDWCGAVNGDAPVVMFVRVRPGLAGARDRVVHIVPVADPETIPDVLIAYCGAEFAPGSIDLLDGPHGMPCVRCLATAPTPGTEQQLPAGDQEQE